MEAAQKIPRLVASTGDTYCCSITECKVREDSLRNLSSGDEQELHLKVAEDCPRTFTAKNTNEIDVEFNYFKSAQWSPDGTSLLTSSADNVIRTFILPPDLLSPSSTPLTLRPYTSHVLPTPTACLSFYPRFSLQTPETTLYLSTPSDLPIRLLNILSPTCTPLATYPLISPTTEQYLTPSSILWTAPGTHFLTGTDCLIALFDISRSGGGPIVKMPTIPSKRHKMKGSGVGMRGIVSALSIQPSASSESVEGGGMLAAGTWTRWVGLYDSGGVGGTVGTWSIAGAADDDAGIGGTGVTQTVWSPCGRYLCVVERVSRGVLVYDVRVTGKLVCWLDGRNAETNQRLGVDAFEGDGNNGMEIWAGGNDGVVRVWEEVGRTEGRVERSWEWRAHDDPVTSTAVHSCGTVVATSSGQRSPPHMESGSSSGESDSVDEDEDEDEYGGEDEDEDDVSNQWSQRLSSAPDNTVKVWSL